MSTLSVQTITDVQSFDFSNTEFAGAYNASNAAFSVANAAFDKANTGGGGGGGSMDYLYVNTSTSAANSYASALVNTANTYTNTLPTKIVAAHTQANISYSIANAAFDKANTGGGGGSMDYLYVNTSTSAANSYAGNMANAANSYASSLTPNLAPAFNTANAAYGASNSLFSIANTNFAVVSMTVASLSDSSGTIAWDASTSRMATVTLSGTGRTVSNPTNLKAGSYVLVVKQDAGGSKTITTWGSVFKWPAAVVPTLSTTGNTTDIFSFWCDGTNLYGTYIPDCR